MRTLVSIALVLSLTGSAAAQAPRFEIGIHSGATILLPDEGDTEYVLGVPGAGSVLGLFPPIYVTIFLAPNLIVEPQVAFAYQSFNDGGLFNTALQAGFLLNPRAPGSAYFAAHLMAVNAFGGGGGNTEFAAGLSAGYRHALKDVLGLRYEARFRRWFDGDLNEVALILGFGVAIR